MFQNYVLDGFTIHFMSRHYSSEGRQISTGRRVCFVLAHVAPLKKIG
jgi:hypothetical protein